MAGAVKNLFDVLEGDKASGTETMLPVDFAPVQRTAPDLIEGLQAEDQARADKAPKFPGAMPFGLKPLEPIAPDVLAENVVQAFKRTGNMAPDQVAEVRSLARQTSLPEPFVQANLAQVRDIAKYPDPNVPELTRDNPGTALFLSDPANMALAKDDVAALQRLENSLADLWPGVQAAQAARDTSPWSAWDRFWQKNRPVDERTGVAWLASAPGQAWEAGRQQDALAFAYSQLLLEGDRPELRRTIGQMKLAQVQVPKAESYLEKILTGGVVQAAQYRDMLPDIGWPSLAGGALMYGTTLAATKNPASAAVAAERGMKVGAGAGAYYSMFKLEGGSALEEYMGYTDANTGKPIDFKLARGMAVLTGAVNAGIEAAELAVLLEMTGVSKAVSGLSEATKRQFVKEAVVKGMGLPGTRALMARIGAKGVWAWLLESGQEGLQELVTIYFGELAKDMHNAQAPGNYIEPMSQQAKGERVGQTVVDASASFLPLIGAGTGLGMFRTAKSLARARVVEAKLNDFKTTLDANRLAQRSPEAVEQAVRTMTGTPEGQEAPPLFINARAFDGYFQQADAMDEAMRVLEVMGISQDEYAHAKAIDADLALPTDKVASTLAQGRHWEALAPDLKVNAFDISARQALGLDIEAEQVRIQELARAFDEAQVPQHEVDRLAGELMATGRVSKNQAIMTASLFGNLARTLTQSGHETPAAWFERNKIRIQADSLESFKRRFGDRVSAADLAPVADQEGGQQQGDIQRGNRVAVPIAEIMQNVRTRLEGYQAKLAEEMARADGANQDSIAALSAAIDRDQTRLERLGNQVDDGQTHIEGPLFQAPMNEDVDLNRSVPVLDAGETIDLNMHKAAMRKQALANTKQHVGHVVNTDTGWNIALSERGARHVAQDHPDEGHYPAMVQVMTVLSDIVKNAVLVETHLDLKKQAGVAQVHRLYSPVRVGDSIYVVKLTVKEAEKGVKELEDFRLYDLRSEKKMPTGTSAPSSGKSQSPTRPAVGISEMTVLSMLEGVKDHEGRLFFQSAPAFYSPTARFLEGINVKKPQPAKFWLSQFWDKNGTPKPGLRPEELSDLGLEHYIRVAQDSDAKISKEQVLQFIKEGGPRLEEITKRSNSKYNYTGNEWQQAINEAEAAGNWDEAARIQEAWEGIDEETGSTANTPKFASYQLPGGENYREVLLTLPSQRTDMTFAQFLTDYRARFPQAKATDAEVRGFYDRGVMVPKEGKITAAASPDVYRSPHWEEPNVLAHVRLNDRMDADGNRVLFIEEIQSDWHQAGRKKGYSQELVAGSQAKLDALQAELDRLLDGRSADQLPTEAEKQQANNLYYEIYDEKVRLEGKRTVGVPNAPFKKSWAMLAFKRILREAVEKGYDAVAWTTGEQQAARYKLSASLESIAWRQNGGGPQRIATLVTTDGAQADLFIGADGTIGRVDSRNRAFDGLVNKPLDEAIGKPMAEKIMAEAEGKESGNGLDIGGGGMKGFYDKMLPKAVAEYVKKLDPSAKVGETNLDAGEFKVNRDSQSQPYRLERRDSPDILSRHNTAAEAWAEAERLGNISVHSLTITPALRQTVADGQALYQSMAGSKYGAIHWEHGQTIISTFEKANVSTVPHESGHLYLTELERLVGLGHATAQQEADLATIRAWLREKDERISEEGQERFANGFLTYLREGKAPTEAMYEVFAKFKRWLLALYKAARGAGVKINPEIRGVYDRMLATQEELDGARNKYGLEPIFAGETSLDESVLTRQELDAYETLANRASLAADIEMQKYHEAERRKYRQQLVEHFDDELRNNKAYRLVTYLAYNYDPLMQERPDRKAKDYKPGPKINLESARYLWGQDVNERVRPGLLSKDSTYTVEQAMIEFEFDSPEAVLEALNFKGGEQRRAFVESGLAQFDADWNEYGTPWANELQERRLDAEARMLQRLTRNFVPASMEGIKRMVSRKVENMTVAQLQSSFQNLKAAVAKVGQQIKQDKFLLAVALKNEANMAVKEQREVDKARVAVLREKWAERVSEANERRRLALAEIRERTQAREEMSKLKDLSKRIFYSKRMDFDYREQAMAIVQRFGLGTPTMAPAMPYDMPPLLQFVQEKGIDVAALAEIPAWLFSEPQSGFRSVQTMTVAQMRELKGALNYLHHQGVNERKMLGLAEDLLITDVAERSVVTMNQLTKGPKAYSERERESRKVLIRARGLMAELGMVRYWADAADGFTNHGPNSKAGNTTTYLVHPFDQAESDKQHALRQMGDKLDKIFEPYLAQDRAEVFKIEGVPLRAEVAQEWGGLWDRQKVLMVALNMGNEGNIRALMGGYGWTYDHLAKITERLTADEWRMVQQIWDTIDELYPLIDHVHRVVNGGPLIKVEPLALDSPAGHLRGGYFPLIFDHRLSDKAAFLGGLDKLMNEVETGAYADEIQHTAAVFRKSNPVNSFTKERKGSSLPPLLSLGVLSSHINSSLHFIHYGLPLRNAYKLVAVPEFRTAWVKALGEDSYMELGNWLRRQARPSLVMPGKFDKMFEKLRVLGSLQALGLSMQTALTQLSSASMSWQEIGFKAFMKGAAIMAEHGADAFAVAADLSPYMADRRHNLDSTMHDLVMRLDLDKHQIKLLQKVGINLTVKDYQDFMFSLIQTMDALVAYPTWYGAYDQALNQRGMDPASAVAYADEKVKRAQASGGIVDAPTFLRSAGVARLFSMFMSFSANLLNNQAYFIRGWRESMISSQDFMRHVMLSWVLPPLLTSCIIAWAKGEPWPEFRDLFFDLFGYLLSGLPLIREGVRSIEFGGRASGAAALKPVEDVGKLVQRTMNLLDGKNRDGEFLLAAQSLVDLVGFSVGIPTRPIWRAVQGVHDMAEGKTVNPMRLFFRAPKEAK
ncbi:MAG: hypothetical protein RDU24_08780 [Humidesulfovibrio sp.]|uniref:LPD3 domain-containing protein n=1 Tax=Humidesulfovibrio sp. TaxID=2910988 RepID=UPI0027E9E976|nr:hypothetical protein [Humidesulfovibrio sp.]MDQ7835462.1 hypothetical protein [Humidesulfovibrio sp.]